MKYLNRVKNVELLGDYGIRITFRDGYSGAVDLWPLFDSAHGPLTEPMRDPAFFSKAYLDGGTLTWPNGCDICSDVLRYYCEQGRVTSRKDMDAYFSEDTPASALREEPGKPR